MDIAATGDSTKPTIRRFIELETQFDDLRRQQLAAVEAANGYDDDEAASISQKIDQVVAEMLAIAFSRNFTRETRSF